MSTSYGKNIKMTVYGGSHDDKIGVIFDGAPKGFNINIIIILDFISMYCYNRIKNISYFLE